MGCKASKEDAVVQLRDVEYPKSTGKENKKNKDSSRPIEVTEDSGSDWGDLVNEIDATEPLKNSKRRRLSISTVNGPMEIAEPSGATAERRYSVAKTPKNRKATVVEAMTNLEIPGMTGKKTEIRLTEAAKLLQDGRAYCQISDAEQIKDLFPYSTFFGVFGELTEEQQQSGFDNKSHDHIGAMPKGLLLEDVGVGYTCRKGLKPESPNQDDFFVLKVDDWSMYGVFDGHGPYGHAVSAFVHRTLPFLIVSDPDFFTDLHACLKRAFHACNHLIALASEEMERSLSPEDDKYWDCMLSGTTCTIVVARENEITVAHVGDSRVIAGVDHGGKKLEVVELSQDHKPQHSVERKRIHSSGGEVKKLEGDIPYRVFCKGRHYPGLAMSRALGDVLAQSVGVSCDPDISTYKRTKHDKFIVVASDGIWEFLSSQEVADMVNKQGFSGCQKSADNCSIEAWKRWLKEEGNVVDDITCLTIWNEELLKKK